MWRAKFARSVWAVAAGLALAAAAPTPAAPRYDHVIVIVEENKGFGTIRRGSLAPRIAELAATYGEATRMYAETHPSEGNYVALLGGDTFGIHDDDAWYCVPGSTRPFCKNAGKPDYVVHAPDAPHLGTQLERIGKSWKAYLEDLPEAGSLAVVSEATATRPPALYAAKHTGFTNFASTASDPRRAEKLVPMKRFAQDLRTDALPAFALVIPNQCNEMHGMDASDGGNVEPTCIDANAVIRRGDAEAGRLVDAIRGSRAWTDAKTNTAIVITWDEDGGIDRLSAEQHACCVIDAANPGGGHIPTVVITNHGPRKLVDPAPYNHYSLLRAIEDVFGLDHLRHAGDAAVVPMTPLFATR